MSTRKIFQNREALQSDYVPENLPFRATQISSVAEILAPILHSSKPSNLLIYGKTGTGKTAVTKHIISKLESARRSKNKLAEFIYCNARLTGTEYRTLAELANGLGVKIPFTGLAVNEVLSRLQNFIKKYATQVVFVMDEIDYLIRAFGDDLLYGLTSSADKISPGFLSIIGISNDLQFKEELGARVLSRLSEEELVFPPYTTVELKTILNERAKFALNPKSYTEGAINLCAALSGSEHGDARRAVDLLRIAGEVAEREGSLQLDEKHVRIALQKIDQDRVLDALATLPLHAKLALIAAIQTSEQGPNHSSSGEVYERYDVLCKKTGIETLTTRRVSGLLTELDTLGLISATIVNYGRYGRTKRIIPRISQGTIERVFAEDDSVKQLIRQH